MTFLHMLLPGMNLLLRVIQLSTGGVPLQIMPIRKRWKVSVAWPYRNHGWLVSEWLSANKWQNPSKLQVNIRYLVGSFFCQQWQLEDEGIRIILCDVGAYNSLKVAKSKLVKRLKALPLNWTGEQMRLLLILRVQTIWLWLISQPLPGCVLKIWLEDAIMDQMILAHRIENRNVSKWPVRWNKSTSCIFDARTGHIFKAYLNKSVDNPALFVRCVAYNHFPL